MKRVLANGIGVLLLAFLCIAGFSGKAEAATWNETTSKTVTKGAFTFHAYFSSNGKESWIYKVEINERKGSTKTLKFPAKVKGAKVTKLGATDTAEVTRDVNDDEEFPRTIFDKYVEEAIDLDGYFEELEKTKKLVIPDSVREITHCAFGGMRALKNVKIPDGVTDIRPYVFYGCKELKEVKLPKKLKKFSGAAFADCGPLKKITLSKKNKKYSVKSGMLLSKNKKTLYWVVPFKSKVEIPNTVKRIYYSAFSHSDAGEIRIPKSVTRIDRGSLYGKWVAKVVLDKKNKSFYKKGKNIYKKKTKALVWKPVEPEE